MQTFHHSPGSSLPFGATIKPLGINFALFSRHAETVTLVLYAPAETRPLAEIPLDPAVNRTGNVWHILIHDLDSSCRYAYRLSGPFDPAGSGHFFQGDKAVLDPYAKAIAGSAVWGGFCRRRGDAIRDIPWRSCIVDDAFDWADDRPLNIPLQQSVIYEMHVRGFTIHPSAGVKHPGTFRGVSEKIPYFKDLGITAVELMPVFEFNENENIFTNPSTGENLKNFWGYSPLAFFAPKASYASIDGCCGNQVREFKEMVKALHKAGIEVILDIVFNHTAEGGSDGPFLSFRGLDNTIYYLLGQQNREYLNFSGCGNTMNCNHPLVRNLIMDCLRYWVMEMHVDGFRFDLASILGRDSAGNVLSNPPIVEQIAEDPILAKTKIIAEAWDAAGLYQVGSFSSNPRWAEWNGRFRDDTRQFICNQDNTVAALATRLAGSSDLYQVSRRRPFNSINFITSHDGFTLHDLVSYNHKHNHANGEENRDGCNHNFSWNSGVEGATRNKRVLARRERRLRTLMVILFVSQGVPMIVSGDEFGRTQYGNNNAYCQDNSISWIDWTLLAKNAALYRFFQILIKLRRDHPVFMREDFFGPSRHGGQPEITWQSTEPGREDWSAQCRTLAFLLDGSRIGDNNFFIMLNGGSKPRKFTIPAAKNGWHWNKIIDTAAPPPDDIHSEDQGEAVLTRKIPVAGMAAVVLITQAGDGP